LVKRKTKKKKVYPKIGKRVVRSNFEYEVYNKLKDVLPKEAKLEYESEKLTYTITAEYTPDFVITFKDGSKLYIEAKGNGRQFDHAVKKKMIAIKGQHPDKNIRIIFYADGKVGQTRKDGTFMRQSDWAKRNGYTFSIKDIPEEWFE
jgi:hypothetical protein